MSRCLEHFVNNNSGTVTVLVATSGDTGGAVANGFYGVEGVEVVILYPSGKVSPVQEKQLTTLGKNIKALEVDGTFDDCQKMVKQAFMDKDINDKLFLTSANSINVARWLPQQFYYFLRISNGQIKIIRLSFRFPVAILEISAQVSLPCSLVCRFSILLPPPMLMILSQNIYCRRN